MFDQTTLDLSSVNLKNFFLNISRAYLQWLMPEVKKGFKLRKDKKNLFSSDIKNSFNPEKYLFKKNERGIFLSNCFSNILNYLVSIKLNQSID